MCVAIATLSHPRNEILSDVRDISTTEATHLSAYTTISGSSVPQVPAAITALGMKGLLRPEIAETFDYAASQNRGVGKQLAMSFLAKNRRWEATDSGIKFTHAGGVYVFAAKQPARIEDLKKQAELFNGVSQAVGMTIWKQPQSRSGPPGGQPSGQPSQQQAEPSTPSGRGIDADTDFPGKLRQ
jgi:hypothetical protein